MASVPPLRAHRGVAALLSLISAFCLGCGRADAPPVSIAAADSAFIGSASCASCHAREFASWKASQHAVAMQSPTDAGVLGRFDSTRFTSGGVTSTLLRRNDRYVVRTDGPRGTLEDFEVRYTFGIFPLQQYLVSLGKGRIQPLTLAWDARPATSGGQRWFSLDDAAHVTPADSFHWTGRAMNWNHLCADCHSTAVRKGYTAAADSFNTTRSEISIGCEACHGPGRTHAARMAWPAIVRRIAWRDDGLRSRLTERRDVHWLVDSTTGKPHRSAPRHTDREIETCAQCHARRRHLMDGYTAGDAWMNFYVPDLIVAGLYHSDGQQRGEVFTYGSFLQSRMYAAGVTCSDCHDPHSGKVRLSGNATCTQCHVASRYDQTPHTLHAATSTGSRCVSCHMPTTTYMKVDPRHDHSMRIPRPDLSVTLGVPNACTGCHIDRPAQWAANVINASIGRTPAGFQRFAGAFAADDGGSAGAVDSLSRVANDSTQPAIVIASALVRLAEQPGPVTLAAARRWSVDSRPMVRWAAAQALEAFPPAERVSIALPMLTDTTRAVRLEAAWLLAPLADSLPVTSRHAFAEAAAEFVASTRYNADRSVSRIALGTFYALRGQLDSASTEFRAAIFLDPRSARAHLYLAEVYRLQGRPADSERMLRDGLKAVPNDAELSRALAALTRRPIR